MKMPDDAIVVGLLRRGDFWQIGRRDGNRCMVRFGFETGKARRRRSASKGAALLGPPCPVVAQAERSHERGDMPASSRIKRTPLPQIVRRIPRRGLMPEHIHDQLVEIWESGMSPAERDGWLRFWRGESDWTAVSPEILTQLDELIIRQAGTLGWRIFLSHLVTLRLSVWDLEPGGLELFDRLYKALARCARIWRGLKSAPIDDPGLHRFKLETVKELKLVLPQMRDQLAINRRQIPTAANVAELFRKTVSGSPRFVHLNQTLESWLDFLKRSSAPPIGLGRAISPGRLFDSWFAWSSSLDQEYVRQKLSSRL